MLLSNREAATARLNREPRGVGFIPEISLGMMIALPRARVNKKNTTTEL
jgi:hypothetical protein